MMDKILFLDIDGPVASGRSCMVQGYEVDSIKGWDPVSCGLINKLIKEFSYTLVISSTWASHGKEAMRKMLWDAGIGGEFHDDWMTPRKFSSNRSIEINWWIEKNQPKEILVLDDMRVEIDPVPGMISLVIEVDGQEGMTFQNFCDVYRHHKRQPPLFLM